MGEWGWLVDSLIGFGMGLAVGVVGTCLLLDWIDGLRQQEDE